MSLEKTDFDSILPPAGGKTLPRAFPPCKNSVLSCIMFAFFDKLRPALTRRPFTVWTYFCWVLRHSLRTAQNTRDRKLSSALAEREVRAMGTLAPTTAPQVVA